MNHNGDIHTLLLSPFFYPEPISSGKYNTILAKALMDKTESIDVLCSHPLYPTWQVTATDDNLHCVNTVRGGRYLKYPKNPLLRRAVLELWFFWFVSLKLLFRRKKYTHIIAVFPPSLFMLLIPFLIKKDRKLIGIVHDLQGVYANRNPGFIKKVIFKAISLVEKRSFKVCDKLIFLSEDMKNLSVKEYALDASNCFVHYPFVTIDEFNDCGNLEAILPSDRESMVYSGALGEKQAPEELGAFMNQFAEKHPNTKVCIFSQGYEFERLRKKYTNVHYYPLVEEDDLPELLMRSTIQVLPQAKDTSDGSLPSKLPNMLASSCKILCVTDLDSELSRILESYSNASVVYDWQTNALVEKARALMTLKTDACNDASLLASFKKESLVGRVFE